MSEIRINPAKKIAGIITIPPDKSISHRAIIFAALAKGKTHICNFLNAQDTRMTMDAFRNMGIDIEYKMQDKSKAEVVVYGKGLQELKEPSANIYVGNSGTTIRLLSGVLAAQAFKTTLYGDASLNKRPMKRIALPLQQMGASISGKLINDEIYPPLHIRPAELNGITYTLPIASAQVKSALLLAALYARGKTTVIENIKSRDHTERMFELFKIPLTIENGCITTKQVKEILAPKSPVVVPGDISSAAFFIVAAIILKDSCLEIENVGINPTRRGIIDILLEMGADIRLANIHKDNFEPTATLIVKSSSLKAVNVNKESLPLLIDEVPILAVAATQAKGVTRIFGAGELRHKETDRIKSMVINLKKMGANIYADNDDLCIEGPTVLNAGVFDSFSDHRTAMSMAIAALLAGQTSVIQDTDCIDTSFPSFVEILDKTLSFK